MFISKIIPPSSITTPVLWFIFQDSKLLTHLQGGQHIIPKATDPAQLGITPISLYYLGTLDQQHCFAAEIDEAQEIPDGLHTHSLRETYALLNEPLFGIAARAIQIILWDKNHRYCGRCGAMTVNQENERAKICPDCGFVCFPRLSPCILVAVTRGCEILLARSPHFRPGIHSVLAGFIEPGESAEQTVMREVYEEVGLTIKNIQYFSSQPWPFPDMLMLAFTAEYAGGEMVLDPVEIESAGWFTADKLPFLPDAISLSRRLIDDFVRKHT